MIFACLSSHSVLPSTSVGSSVSALFSRGCTIATSLFRAISTCGRRSGTCLLTVETRVPRRERVSSHASNCGILQTALKSLSVAGSQGVNG